MLDTYREWLLGPYMKSGVQCQHCHMPDREHTWKGIHDPDTVRQGLSFATRRARDGALVVRVANLGAGHHLPTTPTPAIYVTVERDGQPAATQRIGRHVTFDGRRFHERADTRLAPGADRVFQFGPGRARVRVTVAPDDYYEGFYRQLLARPLAEEAKRELEAAGKRAASSRYVLYDVVVD
jgi:hypothetical protein